MKACPAGWHLPTRNEWNQLVHAAGGGNSAGKKLKSKSPNWDGGDDSGFSALPGGARGTDGSFYLLGSGGRWWMSNTDNQINPSNAYFREMGSGSTYVNEDNESKSSGRSVRCVMD
jgi:uncharacterized protein (TIGR02145 family)